MNTTTYITRFSVIGITLSIMYLSPVAMGGELTIPKSWSPDETLTAKDLNDNFQAIKSAVDDNALRFPLLKTVSLTQTVLVDSGRHYFTNDRLVATPPSDGYLYIEAKGERNCPSDQWTRAWYGLYISNTSPEPTGAESFTHAEIFGFAFVLDSSVNGGDHNIRIMYPHPVTAGVTYHIWYGVQGLNVTSPYCTVVDPTITATFFQSGL